MNPTLGIHRYQLFPHQALNSRVDRLPREGALLRFTTDTGHGYADLHPWPELGDVALEAQLKLLASGKPTSQAQRSLAIAAADAEARLAKRSLFAGLQIPPSHLGVSETIRLFGLDLARLWTEGFREIKVKCGRDLRTEAEHCNRFATGEGKAFRLRLDFNESCSLADFELFLSLLLPDTLAALDFIEDPMLFSESAWLAANQKHRVRLALDRGGIQSPDYFKSDAVDVIIAKPALLELAPVATLAANFMKRLVVTSNFDHPLGQMAAAWEAARVYAEHPLLVDSCGLLTHDIYEANAFSEQLRAVGPQLQALDDVGLGFTSTLESLDWLPLGAK